MKIRLMLIPTVLNVRGYRLACRILMAKVSHLPTVNLYIAKIDFIWKGTRKTFSDIKSQNICSLKIYSEKVFHLTEDETVSSKKR